jgi:hypothetical protein
MSAILPIAQLLFVTFDDEQKLCECRESLRYLTQTALAHGLHVQQIAILRHFRQTRLRNLQRFAALAVNQQSAARARAAGPARPRRRALPERISQTSSLHPPETLSSAPCEAHRNTNYRRTLLQME